MTLDPTVNELVARASSNGYSYMADMLREHLEQTLSALRLSALDEQGLKSAVQSQAQWWLKQHDVSHERAELICRW